MRSRLPQQLLLAIFAILALSSCYAPLTTSKEGNYGDSTLTVYEFNLDGTPKAKKEYHYKSPRKTIIYKTVYRPMNPMALTDSSGPDTIAESESKIKQFKIDDNIYKQKLKRKSFYDGGEVKKEKTKIKSKVRDGCEIVIRRRTKIYNEYGDVVFKDNFNFLYWRQVRKIYDEQGKRLKNRTVKFYFKPKFRNYP